jgi:hypothetical protein
MRTFYQDRLGTNIGKALKSSNRFSYRCDASFDYTYEYQGNAPRLVHTPLTDKCYLTLTQVRKTRHFCPLFI